MPSSTSGKKLPYPLTSDPVASGADAIRKLAQSVDNMIQTQRVTIPITTAGTAAVLAVVFPVPFLAIPTVVVSTNVTSGTMSDRPAVSVAQITTTGFNFIGYRQTGTSPFDATYTAIGQVNTVALAAEADEAPAEEPAPEG